MDAMTARTHERFERQNARVIENYGYGDTVAGLKIASEFLPRLSEGLKVSLATYTCYRDSNPTKPRLRLLNRLNVDVVALCGLSGGLHAVASCMGTRETCLHLGTLLAGECWAAGLTENDSKLAARIEHAVRKRHGALKYRKQATRSIADKAGYRGAVWTRLELLYAGRWLLDQLTVLLPEVFLLDGDGLEGLTITEGAHELALKAIDETIRLNPVFLPTTIRPLPWSGWARGGFVDTRQRPTLLRAHAKETIAAVRSAIHAGTMQPFLDALNAIQDVAWTINTKVLDVMKQCHEQGIAVPGLPTKDVEAPEREKLWNEMTDEEKRFWRYKAGQVKQRNRGLVSDRVLFAEDTRTAECMAGHERFYTPCNADWRGRVYPLPHFNFQRDDRVRALFLFADGAPIGTDGLYWLKVHVANCGDFNKISKRPFDERVRWIDENLSALMQAAENPLGDTGQRWWTTADKPFLFLSAVMELNLALQHGPTFVTRLPISFDGSCSGLQHLCAMTRAEEGSLVNLTPSELPQDVYQRVAGIVTDRLTADGSELAQQCLAYGIDRKGVKRNVMTYSYSSKRFGMSEQQMEDLMRPLGIEVLSGERDVHPFGVDEGRSASKVLASHVYDAIESVVKKPALAMAFLQKTARALAHEGKPVNWVTPTGLPWSNRYHVTKVKRVSLWLHDRAVKISLAIGNEKEINKDKAANGVAPNFVHALDAAHLMLTVNAAAKEGITQTATVHDSFGCLAPQAVRFNQIIREQFVEMYEKHDVLNEVREQALCDLTLHNRKRMPEVPEYGTLNIKDVLHAHFAFA